MVNNLAMRRVPKGIVYRCCYAFAIDIFYSFNSVKSNLLTQVICK